MVLLWAPGGCGFELLAGCALGLQLVLPMSSCSFELLAVLLLRSWQFCFGAAGESASELPQFDFGLLVLSVFGSWQFCFCAPGCFAFQLLVVLLLSSWLFHF